MKRTWIVPMILAAVAVLTGLFVFRSAAEPPGRPGRMSAPGDVVAANGVVEGARPEVALRPEVSGTIATIPFRENEDVPAGALLVELRNTTQKCQVALAQAEVALAKAQFQQARAEWERTLRIGPTTVGGERFDADRSRFLQAQARVDEAEARLRLAEAELAKTRLTTTSAGRILRVYAEPGEQAGPASAQPVLLLADVSRRRIRAFVEELDALRVRPGQHVEVTVDGLPGQVLAGTVALVVPRMGKRGLQTDAPDEYKDLYFREAVIDLEGGADLALNLRVKVHIHVRSPEGKQ